MPNDTRALLLAIENYSRAGDLSARLQGTTAAAFEFARWVRDTKGVSLGDIWICTDSDLDPDLTGVHQFGTSRAQVREALLSLCGDARNKTTQLLVFLSGHGYAYSTTAESAPADIFVCSEYANMATGGDASVIIPELQEMLGYWIGGIDHFYFVDCCRNVIDQRHIKPVNLGLALPGSDVVRPFIYTLYSTATGSQAFTNSGFPMHLLDALRGKGRAKGWTSDNSGMHVLFTLVYEYVKKKVGRQRVDAKLGGGDGVILALPGIPTNDCSIVVRGAASTDEFTVQLLLKGQKIGDVSVIHGASGRVSAKPEVYGIDVRHPKRGVEQVAPPAGSPIDLYDPCDAEFKLVDIERLPRSSGAEARSYIQLNVPPNVTVDLVNLNTNERIKNLAGSVIKEVDPGQYELAVLEEGSPISRQRLAVGPGKTEQPEILSFPRSAARMSILKAIGSVAESRVFDFSASLGPIANVDMGLWLSLLGASKIIAPIDAFSKLSRIPTATFNHLAPGSAAVYVLAAFDAGKVPLAVAAHSSGTLQWHKAKEVNVVEDVQEVTIDIAQPGPNLISVSLGTDQTATFVTHTVPNRVTLLTLSQGSSNSSESSDPKRSLTDLRRYQYILPIAALSNFVDPELGDLVARHTDLKSIRAMFNIQALFCARRAVSFPNVSDSRMLWEEALYGKWLDPMMSVIMCYEMIRRGQKEQLESQLRVVAGNLWRYFKLPDSQAILSILGEQTIPSTPPLFIDGLLPFTENSDLLPFPASKLDYTSPWTTWRNVVDVEAGIL